MKKHWLIGLGVMLAISVLLAACGAQPTAEEIVAKLKEVEASTEDAHAVLDLQASGGGQETDMQLVVEVWEKKPGKLRAEVLEANDPEFAGAVSVADGQQVWMYRPSQNEVLVGEVGSDEPASPRDLIRFTDELVQRVLDTTDVELLGQEEVGGSATYKLEFIPKEGEQAGLPAGSKVTLWVEPERWIVLQAHFNGGIVGEGWMRVRSYELNQGIPDDRFGFQVPEGAQVTHMEDRRPTSVTLDEARAKASFALLVPTYLPEGVSLVDVLAVDEAFILRYDHSTLSSFTIVQGFISGSQPVPPGTHKTEVSVRGQPATLISGGEMGNMLTWMEDDVAITIAGHISQDQILKVAESLQ